MAAGLIRTRDERWGRDALLIGPTCHFAAKPARGDINLGRSAGRNRGLLESSAIVIPLSFYSPGKVSNRSKRSITLFDGLAAPGWEFPYAGREGRLARDFAEVPMFALPHSKQWPHRLPKRRLLDRPEATERSGWRPAICLHCPANDHYFCPSCDIPALKGRVSRLAREISRPDRPESSWVDDRDIGRSTFPQRAKTPRFGVEAAKTGGFRRHQFDQPHPVNHLRLDQRLQVERKRSLDPDNSELRRIEFKFLRLPRVRGVIRGKNCNRAVLYTFEERFNIPFRPQRGIHLCIGVVAKAGFVGQQKVVGRHFSRDRVALRPPHDFHRPCATHVLHDPGLAEDEQTRLALDLCSHVAAHTGHDDASVRKYFFECLSTLITHSRGSGGARNERGDVQTRVNQLRAAGGSRIPQNLRGGRTQD